MAQRTRPVASTRRGGTARATGGTGAPRGRPTRRRRFDAPPPRPFAAVRLGVVTPAGVPRWHLLFAGLQKLANPNFFDANSPSSIQAQLIASIRISPVHLLLGHLLRFAVPIGIVIALAEVAVGLGALLGLWTRVAAAGGMVLSLTLFLTVSFHSSPYYTGADIVFLFAWIPLLLAGSGGVLSLDAVIAARVATENKLGPPTMVPIRFELVQQVCGHYDNDTCTAQGGRRCDVSGCPFLSDQRKSIVRRGPDAVERRTVVLGGSAVAATAVIGAVAAGAAAGLGRAVGGAPSPGGGGTSSLSASTGRAPAPGHHDDDDRTGRATTTTAKPSPARGSAWPARCPSAAPRPSPTRPPVTPGSCSSSPRTSSSPTTRSARTPAAPSGTRQAPSSSCARATARSSTPRRARGQPSGAAGPDADHGERSPPTAAARRRLNPAALRRDTCPRQRQPVCSRPECPLGLSKAVADDGDQGVLTLDDVRATFRPKPWGHRIGSDDDHGHDGGHPGHGTVGGAGLRCDHWHLPVLLRHRGSRHRVLRERDELHHQLGRYHGAGVAALAARGRRLERHSPRSRWNLAGSPDRSGQHRAGSRFRSDRLLPVPGGGRRLCTDQRDRHRWKGLRPDALLRPDRSRRHHLGVGRQVHKVRRLRRQSDQRRGPVSG